MSSFVSLTLPPSRDLDDDLLDVLELPPAARPKGTLARKVVRG